MDETQGHRMKGLSGKVVNRFDARPSHRPRRKDATPAVDRIPYHPVACMGQVHTNLMCAPGLQPAIQKSGASWIAEFLHDPCSRHRAATVGKRYRLPLPVMAVARKLRIDAENVFRLEPHSAQTDQSRIGRVGHAVNDRPVTALDLMGLELTR